MVHKLFRLKEKIFGEQAEIRCESRTHYFKDKNGLITITREFYTWEALLMYWEHLAVSGIENWFETLEDFLSFRWLRVRVLIPIVSSEYDIRTQNYLFAIAFDAVSQDNVAGGQSSPNTLSHTCAGSNRALVLNVWLGGSSVSTAYTSIAATFNSDAMTLAQDKSGASDNVRRGATFYMAAPDATTADISFTWSGSGAEMGMTGLSYSGVDQSTPLNTSANKSQTPGGSSVSLEVTTSVDNCMLIDNLILRHDPASRTAGTGQTERNNNSNHCSSDELVTTAGAYTQSWSYTNVASGNELVYIVIALAPAAASGPANLKTWNGVAKASVKTINGTAIASVKTINGVV